MASSPVRMAQSDYTESLFAALQKLPKRSAPPRLDIDRTRRKQPIAMTKPLEGRTVVVRARRRRRMSLSTLPRRLWRQRLSFVQTIEIRELENYDRLDEAMDHLYGYDWLILTSTNGVEFFIKRLLARGLKIEDLDEIRVCAIGQRTADKLHDAHVHVDLIPSQSTAEGVFAALSEFAGAKNTCAVSTSCRAPH